MWEQELGGLLLRIGARFTRVEPRRRVRDYVRGLLGPVGRKNGWQLAEYAGHATPDGLQHLLSRSRWDADEIRDDLQAYIAEHLGTDDGVLIIDDTGFVKKGTTSAGVQRQYSGTAGACISITACSGGVGEMVDHACASARHRLTGQVRSDPASSRRAPSSAL
ncbi:transposase, partial [Kitasatospora sp. NPDC056138]|uniref:IS701 family transposase n=1 Tax=Kitasatospora sp. NPDC056138 TaxID=3345724 RepID=UPI0035E0942A